MIQRCIAIQMHMHQIQTPQNTFMLVWKIGKEYSTLYEKMDEARWSGWATILSPFRTTNALYWLSCDPSELDVIWREKGHMQHREVWSSTCKP